jgi:hypothetical protein
MSEQKKIEQENNNLMDDEIVTDAEMKMMLSHLTAKKPPDHLDNAVMKVYKNYLKELREQKK